ncbi:MAG TPA: CHAT domain-containing protein [Coleofasciculaceae cyanobacterium]
MKLINIDQVAVAQEFHISVTPLGEDEYLVRIERVAPGVPLAEEQVTWPVEDWLAQSRQLMNDPLLGLLQGDGALADDILFLPEWDESVSQSSLNLVALGRQLYNALFHGSLRDSWMMAQAIAQNQRQILRLRLGLKGTRLPRLPWEVLYAGDRPLATGTDVAFSRYQLSTGRPTQRCPSLQQPLKILMVISGPSDQETLELAQEASQLQEELKNRSSNELPAIQLTILEQPGREQLTQALEQGQYQVFHYSGHSNLGDSGGDVYLVSNRTGLTETLNGADLAGLLVNNGVQLAVFNSCRGAYTSASDNPDQGIERNLAEALVKRGIPAVLAMAERIPDEVALTLTRLFYRNLNQGYPIDLSLSRARQGLISAYGSNQLYWALPVLYLHPEFDGFLINSDNANQTRNDLFTLLDPPDISATSNKEESLFTVPARPNPFNLQNMRDESDPLLREDIGGYEDGDLTDFIDGLNPDDPEADDPSAFIKDLLSQLDTQPTESRATSETVDLRLPANRPNPTPSPQSESATSPVAETTQTLPRQTKNPATENSSASRTKRPAGLKIWWQQFQQVPRLWMVLGTTSVVAIALLSFLFFQNRSPRPEDLLPPGSSISGAPKTLSSQNVNLKTANTATVTNVAIEQFNQGNIATGQKAVEELLNREALPQAKAALEAVRRSQLDDPTVSFLRGRLAWQSVQSGSKDYDVSDARRFWETAHKKQPKSLTYLNALGFAYYAEGNYERANNTWFQALEQIKPTQATANVAGGTAKRDALNTYAGLALGLRRSAQKLPADKRAKTSKAAIEYRQYVMTQDPISFQPDALSKNWLWSENMIKDWRSLLAAKN